VPGTRHSGKRSLPRVLVTGTQGRCFPFFSKRFRPPSPSNPKFILRVPPSPSVALGEDDFPRVPWPSRHSGKALFPECLSSPSATLGEDWLPRVPDFWLSGKFRALGELQFSRSERLLLIIQCFKVAA
jgi:hypothetical protein